MKRLILSGIVLLVTQAVIAQVTFPQQAQHVPNRPEILIGLQLDQDPRLDKLLNWHIEKNKRINGREGYRVEIFFSSERDAKQKALNKKVEFLSLYPETTVHVKYDSPNFRVRVGDFRTKNEALKLHQEIKETYPMAFIVADKIDFPLLKQVQYE